MSHLSLTNAPRCYLAAVRGLCGPPAPSCNLFEAEVQGLSLECGGLIDTELTERVAADGR